MIIIIIIKHRIQLVCVLILVLCLWYSHYNFYHLFNILQKNIEIITKKRLESRKKIKQKNVLKF